MAYNQLKTLSSYKEMASDHYIFNATGSDCIRLCGPSPRISYWLALQAQYEKSVA